MSNWQGWLYVAAVLIPLAAFVIEVLFVRVLKRLNAYIATGAILASFALSVVGLVSALPDLLASHHEAAAEEEHGEHAEAAIPPKDPAKAHRQDLHHPFAWTGEFNWVALGGGIITPSDAIVENKVKDAKGTTEKVLPKTTESLIIPIGIRIDGLSVIMFTMVTFVASLVHIYSMGYMSEDKRYPRFFTYLSLFCFSMLGLLASANVFMVFMCWELVGVCSYLLIGFWYEEKKNADAANKAFIANRVGDVGMLIGLGLIWAYLGTFNIADINGTANYENQGIHQKYGLTADGLRGSMNRMTRETAGGDTVHLQLPEKLADGHVKLVTKSIPYWALVVAGLGIFAGCVGKSAQVPLQVWLPDAMAGPTPVSALIHAATMVAAGVYLVGRFFPLFTDGVLLYIAYTGGVTLFIAATIALVQTDYKKVLAYSTVSQLGFMMLALGVGGWAAGLFHLITHAFFKALLFLGAGSVYHSVHTYEMPTLGGLRKKMPWTAYTMLAGTLAISGVPFFSGFYSKDAILGMALKFSTERPEHMLLFILPAVGAMITAFYMFRMWFLLFTGELKVPEPAHDDHGHAALGHGHGHSSAADHVHESGPLMKWPLVALAFLSVFAGLNLWLGIPVKGYPPFLEQMLESAEPLPAIELGSAQWMAMGASVIIATLGIGGAALFYLAPWKRFNAATPARMFRPAYNLFVHKWYFDEAYNSLFVQPTLALSRFVSQFDKSVVDGVVNLAGGITIVVSKFEGVFDKLAIDGLVSLVAGLIYFLGDVGRSIQTGRLRNYLAILAMALVGLFAGVFYWIRV